MRIDKWLRLNWWVVLIVVALTGCKTSDIPRQFDGGEVIDHTFHSSFFELTLPLPSDWTIMSDEELVQFINLVNESRGKKKVKAFKVKRTNSIRSAFLLLALKYELGSPGVKNPTILVMAENLKFTKDIFTEEDVLEYFLEENKKSGYVFEVINYEDETLLFGERKFHLMTIRMKMGDDIHEQMVAVSIIRGFALAFIIGYAAEEDKKEQLEILNGIKFSLN